MEEDQCWMWTKTKHSSLSSNILTSPAKNSSSGDSWEEQAFAEDERVGGCIWPPRSYSCSFCSREFRSAQALGGHMNVHRRDRARLNQPPSPHNKDETTLYPQNPFTSSFGSLYSNANPNSDHLDVLASKAKLAPRSSIHENSPPYETCISWSNFAEERLFSQKFDLIGAEDVSTSLDTNCKEEADMKSCKRRRIIADASSIIPFFSKSVSVDSRHLHIKSQMFEFINPSSIEELDLELRLGHSPPKV